MTSKKSRYLSIADAGEMLKKAMGAAQPKPKVPAEASRPSDNSIAEIERKFLEMNVSQHSRAGRQKKPSKDAAKKKGKGQVREILRGPLAKEALRKVREHEEQKRLAELAKSNDSTPVRTITKGRECFDHIVALVGESTPEIEERPAKVSKRTRDAVTQAVSEGARAFTAASEWDEDGFIVGFDFGTSSLKLAVRQPGYAGDPSAMMPVPTELRSGAHAHLWQSALWFCPKRQSFSLLPAAGLVPLAGLKTGIIAGNGNGLAVAGQPVTRSEAATAFVALHIAHAFGWYHLSSPLGAAGHDKFLAIKVGIPVAAFDNEQTFKAFRRIVVAARNLVSKAENLTLQHVRDELNHAPDTLPDGWYLVPELTAAIAGYAAGPESQTGSHVLIDVGASTLDIVAFNLVKRTDIAVISAAVELLGSASLDVARAAGVADADFSSACDHEFGLVFNDACRPSRGGNCFSPINRPKDVQLVITGGGCASSLHTKFIANSNDHNRLGSLPMLRPQPPATCKAEDCDRSRLLLAYGLTRDELELPELKPPSQVPSIAPAPLRSNDNYISKDMT